MKLLRIILLASLSVIPILSVRSADFAPQANATCFLGVGDCESSSSVPYCDQRGECGIDEGVNIVKDNIEDIEKDRTASRFVQDVVAYLIIFMALVAVLYIIYAGFQVLTAAGDEEKLSNGKKIILYVALGMIFIFLAYSITKFVINLTRASVTFAPAAYAAETRLPDLTSFAGYREAIELAMTEMERQFEVNGKISDVTLKQMRSLVKEARTTFPDEKDKIYNANLANKVDAAIEVLLKNTESEAKTQDLAEALVNFTEKIKISEIKGKATATPREGNAPMTVSLRASDVVDPSGITVPKENFVWWLKQSNGSKSVIGTGPSISYTFKEERVYTVFLTVVSSSTNSNRKTDVLPLETQIQINVLPRVGNVRLFVNGNDVTDADTFKVTPREGAAGVLFDATATEVGNGTKITSTSWNFGNGKSITRTGFPRIEQTVYASEGTYEVSLTMRTNENKTIVKKFDLEVRDPIARIQSSADSKTGNVGDEIRFNANTSYSDLQLKFFWEIVDLSNNKMVLQSGQRNVSYTFNKIGRYQIRLRTTTPLAKEDTDTITITIEPREPIASFDSKMSNQETPNIVTLDATRSYDPDTFSSAGLKYEWSVDGTIVQLDNPSRNGALGTYTFNTLGNHRVVLRVYNESGRETLVNRDIQIDSLLSVRYSASPKVARAGQSVTIFVDAPKASIFEWTFGDGTNDTTTTGRATHQYKTAGAYNVTVRVREGNTKGENSINRTVHVVGANSPFAYIGLTQDAQTLYEQSGQCSGRPAYVVNRATPVEFTGMESINANGLNTDLEYVWKYGDNKSSSQGSYSYKFDELGCTPVTLTVVDKKTNRRQTSTTYVRVVNLPPEFTTIAISANTDKDPVVVNVSATNAQDRDGVIVSYLWYYYTDNDPEPQDFRITQAPNTSFVIPKVTGTYYFGVVMEDSNGAKVNSRESREEQYSLSVASDNINTPLLSLTASSTSVFTDTDINFAVSVKNVLETPITEGVEYKWDFDGDGFYDQTTKEPGITHAYALPGTYNMKVKATYKGISNTRTQTIVVRNVIKPDFEMIGIGNKILFVNTSEGVYTSSRWTTDGVDSDATDAFVHDFGDTLPETMALRVSDGESDKEVTKLLSTDKMNKLRVEKEAGPVVSFTYPKSKGGTVTLDREGQALVIYLGESKAPNGKTIARYEIDTNTAVDSNLNGSPNDDADNSESPSLSDGSPFVIKSFTTTSDRVTMRLSLYDADGNEIGSENLNVVLAYRQPKLDEKALEGKTETGSGTISDRDKVSLEKIKDLIRSAPEANRLYMMEHLAQLQESWFDPREKTRSIISFEEYIGNITEIEDAKKQEYYDLLDGFLFADDKAVSDVNLAASVVRNLVPKENPDYAKVEANLSEILSHPTNTELNKKLGSEILDIVKNDSAISNDDKLLIRAQIETIVYGGAQNVPASETPAQENSSTLGSFYSFLWYVLYAFLAIIGLFFLAFIVFFIKFKLSNAKKGLGFQDYVIESFTQKKPKSATPAKEIKPKPAGAEKPAAPTVDPLANTEATPVAETFTPAFVETSAEPEKLPSWLKGAESETSTQTVGTPDQTTTDDVPAWMKEAPAAAETPAPETLATDSDTPEWMKPANDEPTTTTAEDESDLPAWLKGMNSDELKTEVAQELGEPQPAEQGDLPDWLKGTESQPEARVETPEIPASDPSTVPESSDLPDWLKGTESQPEARVETPEIPASDPSTVPESSDLPDWLKDWNAGQSTPESPTPAEPIVIEENENDPVIESESNPIVEMPEPAAAPAPQTPTDGDDLPDWLKDWQASVAETPTPAEPIVIEEKEDEPTDVSSETEPEAPSEPVPEEAPKKPARTRKKAEPKETEPEAPSEPVPEEAPKKKPARAKKTKTED
jgi:PKD repeat protein